jgi:cellulose synthase/poly-beta-1,6-N-acetylglucosamine synthase-like glycosyltransferase
MAVMESAPATRLDGAHVTVVIPTRNRPSLLERSVRSVVAQTMQPKQLIVVEDGPSTDTTAVVLAEAARATSIRIDHLASNGGPSNARNTGLTATTTPLITFLDDDDWWKPLFLQRCVETLSTVAGRGAVVTDTELVVPGGTIPRTVLLGSATDCLYRNGGFTGQNGLFRTDAVRAIGGYDPTLRALQDRDLQLRLLRTGVEFDVIREPLAVVDQAHSVNRISTSTARADGMLQFYRKWSSIAPPTVKARMALRTAVAQRRSSDPVLRLLGLTAYSAYAAQQRVGRYLSRSRGHIRGS